MDYFSGSRSGRSQLGAVVEINATIHAETASGYDLFRNGQLVSDCG